MASIIPTSAATTVHRASTTAATASTMEVSTATTTWVPTATKTWVPTATPKEVQTATTMEVPTATTTEVQTATATGVALGILVVAPKSGEKGVALKVGEKTALYLTPLHAKPQPYSEGSFIFFISGLAKYSESRLSQNENRKLRKFCFQF